jgi:chloride channel protein, CIC family
MTIDDAVRFFASDTRRHKSYPLVASGGHVEGMAGRADVLRWRAESSHGDETLFDRVSDSSLIVGYADEPVSQLADRMVLADRGRVPIVDRKSMRLVGLVSRKDLLNTRAITRKTEATRAAFFGRRAASQVVTQSATSAD